MRQSHSKNVQGLTVNGKELNLLSSIVNAQSKGSALFPTSSLKEKKMLRRIILTSIASGFVSLWVSSFAVASMVVHIGGAVKDAQTSDPLPDANVLLLGTGLGAGIVVDDRLIYGENGVAGQLGHTTIDPGGRMCGCKRQGCVESYVSAKGICRTVFELLARSTEETELREISYSGLTAEKIHELAIHGDRIANEAFEITGTLFG